MPLALALPGVRLVMVEVKTLKSVFLREAARELGLAATVVTARHESLLADPTFHDAFDLLSVESGRTGHEHRGQVVDEDRTVVVGVDEAQPRRGPQCPSRRGLTCPGTSGSRSSVLLTR